MANPSQGLNLSQKGGGKIQIPVLKPSHESSYEEPPRFKKEKSRHFAPVYNMQDQKSSRPSP